jgi:hypothetical protein
MVRSMLLARGSCRSSSADGLPPLSTPPAALAVLPREATARIEQISDRVKPGLGAGSSSMTGWEESGRSHPARTALNLAQPS